MRRLAAWARRSRLAFKLQSDAVIKDGETRAVDPTVQIDEDVKQSVSESKGVQEGGRTRGPGGGNLRAAVAPIILIEVAPEVGKAIGAKLAEKYPAQRVGIIFMLRQQFAPLLNAIGK